MGDEGTFQAKVSGVCPFCQRNFQAGTDSNGVDGILHELPMCKEFEEKDPAEYLKAVRLRLSD